LDKYDGVYTGVMLRDWVRRCVPAMMLGCAAGGVAPKAFTTKDSTEEASNKPVPQALAEARRLRAEAEAIAAPQVPTGLTKAKTIAFMEGPLKAWIGKKRGAVDRAASAYSEAFEDLRGADLSAAALELGDLWNSFAAKFIELGLAAMPPALEGNPETAKAYRGAIEDAASSQRELARAAYELCAGGDPPLKNDGAAQRCRQELAKLPQIRKRPAATHRPRVQAVERAWVPTRQPSPCTFAGSLRLFQAPISSTPGGEPFAWLDAVEVSRLELPKVRSEPLHVTTSWPIRTSFYIAADRAPLALRSRIDFVQGHVWLAAGAAVAAAAPENGRALVYRRTRAEPDPAKLISCAELTLADEASSKHTKLTNPKDFAGDVVLHSAPDGPKIAQFSLDSSMPFEVLEERGTFRRVASSKSQHRDSWQTVPFDFDAWTQAQSTDERSFGLIGLLRDGVRATHVVTNDLELFSSPESTSTVGTLVKGVPVLVGETQNGFVNVDVPGLQRPNEAWGFWLRAAEFETNSRKH
jgi:hypothetical protein